MLRRPLWVYRFSAGTDRPWAAQVGRCCRLWWFRLLPGASMPTRRRCAGLAACPASLWRRVGRADAPSGPRRAFSSRTAARRCPFPTLCTVIQTLTARKTQSVLTKAVSRLQLGGARGRTGSCTTGAVASPLGRHIPARAGVAVCSGPVSKIPRSNPVPWTCGRWRSRARPNNVTYKPRATNECDADRFEGRETVATGDLAATELFEAKYVRAAMPSSRRPRRLPPSGAGAACRCGASTTTTADRTTHLPAGSLPQCRASARGSRRCGRHGRRRASREYCASSSPQP